MIVGETIYQLRYKISSSHNLIYRGCAEPSLVIFLVSGDSKYLEFSWSHHRCFPFSFFIKDELLKPIATCHWHLYAAVYVLDHADLVLDACDAQECGSLFFSTACAVFKVTLGQYNRNITLKLIVFLYSRFSKKCFQHWGDFKIVLLKLGN